MKKTVVIVEWIDAHQGTDSWTFVSDLDTDERVIHTVGFLLSLDDGGKPNHVTLLQSIDEEQEMVDNVLHIPVGMVRVMRTLGVVA